MGCQSSLFSNPEYRNSQLQRNSSQLWNLNFSDFVKANVGEVYDEYHFTGWIYRSSNSIVRWAMHRRSKMNRVVKIIKRNISTEKKTMNEINILKKLDNPSIIKLHQYFIDQEFIYLIFQPIEGKHIYNHIVGVEEYVLRNMQKILKQIFIGIQHCHSRGVVHCNIIPQNILIVKAEKEIFIKIVGFGDAVNIENQKQVSNIYQESEQNLTLNEIMIKKKISETYRSPEKNDLINISKQDIWSIGIIMSTIMSKIFGNNDFLNDQGKLKQIVNQKSDNIQQSIRSIDLLKKLLVEDPGKRPTASECLNHEYFMLAMKTSPWKITVIYRSLHNFQINQKLKTFLSMYITFKQTNIQEQNQFLTEFYNLDKNKDGVLQYDQLLEGLQNYYEIQRKQALKYIDEIFQHLDKNRNMCIQYSEFLLGTVNLAKIVERKSIENIFNEIDRNGDGYIDMEELKEIIGKYGVKLPENLTKINIDQFQEILANMINWKKN